MKTIFLFFTIAILSSNCKSVPSQGPASTESAVLGLEVVFEKLIANRNADKVYLVKLEPSIPAKKGKEEIPASLISKNEIITTNWKRGKRAYYLNIQPGEYVIVGAEYEEKQPKQTTSTTDLGGGLSVSTTTGGGVNIYTFIFSKEIVEKSRIKVLPGKVNFVGKILVDSNKDYDKADEVQKYYAERLRPGMLETGKVMSFFSLNGLATLKTFANDEATKKEFLENSKDDFTDTTWTHLFK